MELFKKFFSGNSKKDNDDSTYIDDDKNNTALIEQLNDTQKDIVQNYFNFLEANFLEKNFKLFNPIGKQLSEAQLEKLDKAKNSFGILIALAIGNDLTLDQYENLLSKTYNVNQLPCLSQIYKIAHCNAEESNTMLKANTSSQMSTKEKSIIIRAACALFRNHVKNWLEINYPNNKQKVLDCLKELQSTQTNTKGLRK